MDYKKYCSLTFNDVLLDKDIDGYMTINVEGRGLKPRRLETVEIKGRDGSFIEESTINPNILKWNVSWSQYLHNFNDLYYSL